MENEKKVLNLLGDVWNAFYDLVDVSQDVVNPDDEADFRKAIHDAQRIVSTIHAQKVSPQLFNHALSHEQI